VKDAPRIFPPSTTTLRAHKLFTRSTSKVKDGKSDLQWYTTAKTAKDNIQNQKTKTQSRSSIPAHKQPIH